MTYILLFIAAALSYFLRKLTLTGAITGWVVASLIYTGAGYEGISLLAAFFILASLATKGKGSKRTSGQVLANGGVAAILGLCACIWPQNQTLFQLMMAGSLASATADTLSSELGTVYGKRFINIITLKNDERGLDGVISIEGTLIGLTGAAIIAIIYCLFNSWGIQLFYIMAAGFIGNIIDSVLGATLERKNFIDNNVVNFLNTAVGALICLLLFSL
ncbi:DUF92 domain-containing protein [Mucilaginibacter sp. X5P1]|uniref:DUF92 domain-containing protein n=1 Tax=Mucilaginibacter sp. X5P1 TaxID=2723088 RepID=UPI0016207D77|nr:DUF92 domain-containing protein [Mucilaginibacter sp. X5P1]MBB6136725.1 uncharacterized protein (TIGR00297 family) [Mucilaginibacter sp. X5P1]